MTAEQGVLELYYPRSRFGKKQSNVKTQDTLQINCNDREPSLQQMTQQTQAS
jgi:hypothetical protein